MGLEIGKQTFSFPDPRLERLTLAQLGMGRPGMEFTVYPQSPFICLGQQPQPVFGEWNQTKLMQSLELRRNPV